MEKGGKFSLPLEDFFITTKLNTSEGFRGKEWAHAEIEKSLKKLQTDYVDLFLIHFSWENQEEMLEAWHVLEDYYARGIFKAIGVSNFEKEQLDFVIENGKYKPAVNQIISHPGKWNDELITYNKEDGIATVAWSPIKDIWEVTGTLVMVLIKVLPPLVKIPINILLK